MASRIIEEEVIAALNCIAENKNFIISDGAGSGKTYSLVSLIEEMLIKYPLSSIICITYTNNAVGEIKSRINNDRLYVSTIHEFLWKIIKKYQLEIKEVLVGLVNDNEQKLFRKPDSIKKFTIDMLPKMIKYDEYLSLEKGRISHDHLLIIANQMFKVFPKLCDVLKDFANCILIDEYQDTDPKVIDILLEQIKKSNKKCVIGFFGDSMQAIYDSGVGNLDEYDLTKIYKSQNRRNPEKIINLANELRVSEDSVYQIPSKDITAKNMYNGKVIQGSVKFVYGSSLEELKFLKESKLFKEWDLTDSYTTKELRLTHNLNAQDSGFKDLFDLYNYDEIYKLIRLIRAKVKNEELDSFNKTFGEIVVEAKIMKGRKPNKVEYITQIESNPLYSPHLSYLKDLLWADDVDMYRIEEESLLSYKLNGMTGRYTANSKRDKVLVHLDKVYEIINLYQSGNFQVFLQISDYKIDSYEKKQDLSENMNYFIDLTNRTIQEVIFKADEISIYKINEPFNEFINNEGAYLWNRLKTMPFKQYVKSIEYQQNHLPFATQHSVKGSEYDNVLVILDNGKWNNYDFKTLFGKGSISETVKKRTKKVFYVCCTRAKRNLIVFMPTEDEEIVEGAKKIFGDENVLSSNIFKTEVFSS